MSPSHILEPTYQALRERLIGGEWPAGFRLDTARLAADFGVSKSPVRDSLNRLTGERMVDFEPGYGFHVPRLDETQLRDIFAFNLVVLLGAVGHGISVRLDSRASDPVDRAASVFAQIGHASGNAELQAAIFGLNDRLAVARRFDAAILSEPLIDLDALGRLLSEGGDVSDIHDRLTRYHMVRQDHAADFARLLAGKRT